MGIYEQKVPSHWNYFLCLEEDFSRLSRWVEFTKDNFNCYSIEIARLLLVCSSEADVIAKNLCKIINKEAKASSIHKYREILVNAYPELPEVKVESPRFGLSLTPWSNWKEEEKTPLWWTANNKIKHHRGENFEKANLKNALNSLAGLFLLLMLYYSHETHALPVGSNLLIPNDFAYLDGSQLVFYRRKANNLINRMENASVQN